MVFSPKFSTKNYILFIQLYEIKAAATMLLAINTMHSIALQKGNRISITNISGKKKVKA